VRKLTAWSSLEIRMQDKVTVQRLITYRFKGVEEFRYFGTNLRHQTSTQEEIKNRMKSGNACYLSVQNLLFSGLLSKIINIKIYRIIILPVFLWGLILVAHNEGGT